jgi:hypothetical protein
MFGFPQATTRAHKGRGSFGGSGLLCILRNREDALLPLIIQVATSPVAPYDPGPGSGTTITPAPFLLYKMVQIAHAIGALAFVSFRYIVGPASLYPPRLPVVKPFPTFL